VKRTFAADLHIHSRFSRATSRDLAPRNLWVAAQRKGLALVGTGDCVHPGWLSELEQATEPAEDGFLRLSVPRIEDSVPAACRAEVRFALSTEISCIYRRDGRVRKVHHVILLSSLPAARRLHRRLDAIGNVRSDGRPILGLDSRDLLTMVLEADSEAVLFPAHVWTPWFSVLGSKSGFDSVEECFGDLTSHVTVLETGLSSDPPMNRRVSHLDRFGLVSSSDAHSVEKLGREATVFDCAASWEAVRAALSAPGFPGLAGTIELYPEEGKYHLDGHRACAVRLTPDQTRTNNGLCPSCGKPVTVGVLSRVEQLADRAEPAPAPCARPHRSFVPLAEVVGQAVCAGTGSKKVRRVCDTIANELGPELTVLGTAPEAEIERVAGDRVAEAIRRMRAGKVRLEPGYDGLFGRVTLLD